MTYQDLWGIDPDQQGLYGQDFFYGAWLSDTRALLNLDDVLQRIQAFESKPSRTAQQETAYQHVRETAAKRQAVLTTTRAEWADWLMEAPAPAPQARCQWCGRVTRLWVRQAHGHDTVLQVGGTKFTDTATWRYPSRNLGLCPSCGLMVKSENGSAPEFSGIKQDAKITRINPDQYRVVAVGGATPWWTWPWDHTPALWTHAGRDGKKWSQRYWVHQTVPTWSQAALHIWVAGHVWTVDGTRLLAVQKEARDHVQQIQTALTADLSKDDCQALSKSLSQAARERWPRLLDLPPEQESLIYECLWIPTVDKLQNMTEASASVGNDSSSIKEAII